ncbi:MAG: DUF3987 domain-containing protein [Deltaproteobacteria bacterium]|nr:DUF3987 domain-containing protein [Deltaproteobacteria bacterium]
MVGDVVKGIEPHSEADPLAILIYFLTAFGNVIGHKAHWRVEHTLHFLNLFVAMVGDTSRGRKGTSRSTVDHIFRQIDERWFTRRVVSGSSSGQGLIWHARDEIAEERDGKKVIVDRGEPDKRLMIVEEEFSSVLKLSGAEGNILSATLRQAWDCGDLRTLTSGRKVKPVVATGAHISLVGHITKAELLRHLDSTEQANGFANRFLWFIVERSKSIPNPTGTPDAVLNPLIEQLRRAVVFAMNGGEIRRDAEAEQVWAAIYSKLTEGGDGMVGAITARAAPQCMRLSALYALLDCSRLIRIEHLKAALALWDYSLASVQLIFGDSIGDPTADKILRTIKTSEDGLTSTDIYNAFSRHNASGIDAALRYLAQTGLIEEKIVATGGRPRTIYIAKRKDH